MKTRIIIGVMILLYMIGTTIFGSIVWKNYKHEKSEKNRYSNNLKISLEKYKTVFNDNKEKAARIDAMTLSYSDLPLLYSEQLKKAKSFGVKKKEITRSGEASIKTKDSISYCSITVKDTIDEISFNSKTKWININGVINRKDKTKNRIDYESIDSVDMFESVKYKKILFFFKTKIPKEKHFFMTSRNKNSNVSIASWNIIEY